MCLSSHSMSVAHSASPSIFSIEVSIALSMETEHLDLVYLTTREDAIFPRKAEKWVS